MVPRRSPFRFCTFNVEWFFEPTEVHVVSFGIQVASVQEKAARLADRIAPLKSHVVVLQEVQDTTVLETLCSVLRERHQLDFAYRCGGISSGRTGQRVGLIYDAATVEHLEGGSFRANEDDLDRFVKEAGFPRPTLEKNIWARLRYDGATYCVMNVHLKANWKDSDVAIRLHEARALQAMLGNLAERYPEDALLVAGDFNDLDTDIPAANEPRLVSGVVPRIKAGTDAVEGYEAFDNASRLVAQSERVSNIWGDLIDHVLYRNCRVTECTIHREENVSEHIQERTSDHFPVLAVVE